MVIVISEKDLRIKVNEEIYNQFINTVIQIEGYKRGNKKVSLEQAMKLFINYGKPYKDKRLIQVAKENNLEPWELGKILIDRFMQIHTELGLNIDYLSNDEHFRIVLEYIEKYGENG